MKRIKYLEFLPIIIISFLLFRLLNEKFLLSGIFAQAMNLCKPFFWALAIAYIVNIAMNRFEKTLKLSRGFSLSLAYLAVFLVLALLFSLVIPILVDTVPGLITSSASYAEEFGVWYNESIASAFTENSEKLGADINEMIISKFESGLKLISGLLEGLVAGIGNLIVSITTGLIQFFIGLVISVYVLFDKENFFIKTKRLFTAFFGKGFTDKAAHVLKDADEIFGNYLVGKSIDSAIIGVIAIVGFKILGLQYGILFGIIVGVTNMIPYFGPMIGAIPVVLFTVFISPMQALWAAIFILVLQQVDGNIIGPKIVGDKVGIPALWGVVSVTVGGTLFGFLGMLLGTPVFTLFRKIVLDVQEKRLEAMGLQDCCALEAQQEAKKSS